MATPDSAPPPSADRSDDRRSSFSDAALAHVHGLYRNDLGSLQVAIANSSGEERRRLQMVLANLRSEKR